LRVRRDSGFGLDEFAVGTDDEPDIVDAAPGSSRSG
jgi:hypothetical protein